MNNNNKTIGIVILILVLLIGGFALLFHPWTYVEEGPQGYTSTSTVASSSPVENPNLSNLTLASGEVALAYPNDSFGLATSADQVLVHSYIPSCDQGFQYCLYYSASTYAGTNFESAGVRVNKRTDLTSEKLCLTTPPAGYSASTAPANTNSQDAYSTSVFSPVGDAAAGHYASGALYRLFVRGSSSCYEFETRVGETQFANYPSGTIQKFSDLNRSDVNNLMRGIIDSVTLAGSGTKVIFP